jgi:DNA polymerase-1
VPLRKAFRCPPGHVVFLVDQSGIEMRIIIERTQEKELLDMLLLDADADVHHPTLECFLGVNEAKELMQTDKKEYKVQRGAYKNVGFGIAYGASDGKVAFTLGKRPEEIKAGVIKYRHRFPKIDAFTPTMSAQVRKKGYIETAFGRRLYIPQNKAYIGSNYDVQGTAAEILKRGEVEVDKFLHKELNDRMKMVMTIHDELIFAMPRYLLKEKDSILSEISRLMTTMSEIRVPLRVEWKMTTTDWNSAKSIKVEY